MVVGPVNMNSGPKVSGDGCDAIHMWGMLPLNICYDVVVLGSKMGSSSVKWHCAKTTSPLCPQLSVTHLATIKRGSWDRHCKKCMICPRS